MTLNTDHLERCIDTLDSALGMLSGSNPGNIEYEVFRNAAVKGFELTLETAGKLLRKTLKAYFAAPREVDRLTFKDVFRYAAKHGLLPVETVERWFRYRDNRNTTAHDYGEGFAEETLGLLPAFAADARALLEIIRNAPT